jgi:peptidoglycan/xylan/chitin deacetylase (PgdA/CDA1 family)
VPNIIKNTLRNAHKVSGKIVTSFLLALFMISATTVGYSQAPVKSTPKAKTVHQQKHYQVNTIAYGIPVITYHHLLRNDENRRFRNNREVVSVEQFAAEMKMLSDNGFKTLTLGELDEYLNKKLQAPKKSVVITFDDGYLSNYIYAYPILKQYHFRATLFAVAHFINNQPDTFNPDKLNFISWQEIKGHSDVFEVASHTYDMHHLDKHHKGFLVVKSPELVKNDLIAARNIFHSRYFAYPYGQYNKITIQLLREAGYRLAFTEMPGRIVPSSPKFELRRNAITPFTTPAQFKQIVGIN